MSRNLKKVYRKFVKFELSKVRGVSLIVKVLRLLCSESSTHQKFWAYKFSNFQRYPMTVVFLYKHIKQRYNITLDSRALLRSTGIFKEAATTTVKTSDAKGVGTRFEMREVVLTFWPCPSDLSEKREKIKPWRIEGDYNIPDRISGISFQR